MSRAYVKRQHRERMNTYTYDEQYRLPTEIWIKILSFMYHQPPGLFNHLSACVDIVFGRNAEEVFTKQILPMIQWLPLKPVLSSELLVHCKGLRYLRIDRAQRWSVEEIQALPNLSCIKLNWESVALVSLANVPTLRKVIIKQHSSTCDNGNLQVGILREMLGWKNLCQLEAEGTCVSDCGLAGLKNLDTLHLKEAIVSGFTLSSLTNLTSLNLEQCPYVSTTTIATLTNLRSLTLHDYVKNPNFVLTELATLTKLERLVVYGKYPSALQYCLSAHFAEDKLEVRECEHCYTVGTRSNSLLNKRVSLF